MSMSESPSTNIPKETPWEDPRDAHRLQLGTNVEFVTIYGVRHLGIVAKAFENSDRPRPQWLSMPDGWESLIFKSESTENPEYFSQHQIEKYRVTKEVVPKKRLLNVTRAGLQSVLGILSPLFSSYIAVRYFNKVERPFDFDDCQTTTSHYRNEKGENQWETSIYLDTAVSIMVIEVEGAKTVELHTWSRNGKEMKKSYGFHQVAQATEEILRFAMSID